MSTLETCEICYEEFDIELLIICDECEAKTCQKCCEEYLLSIGDDPMCHQCNKRWNYLFMTQKLSKHFLNKSWMDHRKKVLLDREKILLSTTQIKALIKKYERMVDKQDLELDKEIERHLDEVKTLIDSDNFEQVKKEEEYINYELKYFKRQVNKFNKEILKIYEKNEINPTDPFSKVDKFWNKWFRNYLKKNKRRPYYLQEIIPYLYYSFGSEIIKDIKEIIPGFDTRSLRLNNLNYDEKVRFKYRCMKDKCLGYLDEFMTCMMCSTKFCGECMNELVKDHVCKEEDIKTTKLLMNDSKPCPSCSIITHRISGCDFMYCPECHANWNWITGKVYYVRERVAADPHANFVDARKEAESGAGGPHYDTPEKHVIREKINKVIDPFNYLNIDDKNLIGIIYNIFINLIEHEIIPKLFNNRINVNSFNEDLRIKYLLKDIDENSFKKSLFTRDKTYFQNKELHELLLDFMNKGSTILNKWREESQNKLKEDFKEYLKKTKKPGFKGFKPDERFNNFPKDKFDNLNKIRVNFNNTYKKISYMFNKRCIQFEDNWEIKYFKAKELKP